MNRLLLVGAIALLPTVALAQGHCPDAYVCVDYEGQVIEVDPSGGHYQEIVVEERSITVKTLDGLINSNEKVTLLPLISNGDSYTKGDLIVEAKTGIYAEAELGDVFILGEDQ